MLEPQCGPSGGRAGRRTRRGAVPLRYGAGTGSRASDPPHLGERAVRPLRVAGFHCMRATMGQACRPAQLGALPSCLPTTRETGKVSPFLPRPRA